MNEQADVVPWGDLSKLGPTRHHYRRAPIAEAILALGVELPAEVSLDDLREMMSEDSNYPKMDPAVAVEGHFQVVDEDVFSSAQGHTVGYAWPRDDGKRVVQAHLNRFVFSWLPPYQTWDDFLSEAEVMWGRYRAAARPDRVVSIGTRFVNRINIPKPQVEIKDYLRTSVDISPYLPQAISGLFMQVEVPLPLHDCVATITSLLTPPAEEGQTSLVFDIDASQTTDLKVETETFDHDLRARLNTLRDAKNFVFEACITDATRGLID